ncbi:MAG: carbohydrate binding family 9 domain-containing protein, partial [Vicinamibacterales bacterium]
MGYPFGRALLIPPVLCLLAGAGRAAAQTALPDDPMALAATPRPAATAVRAAGPIAVDGALDDEAWQVAKAMDGFLQAEPLQGQAASETTEVRVLFDDEAVYVGAWLNDADPAGIVTTSERRDAFLGDQDSFQVVFDTFHDRQNGFLFGTNASGVQFDAQVRNQVPNSNWDGSWEVRTRRSEKGWTAEFRIPLRTLRYGPSPQTWGMNFLRRVQRRRERAYWA